MKTIFINISGQAQHGKSTTGEMLKTALESKGRRVLLINYADLLKFICMKYFGWDGKKDDKGRTLLQQVGTEGVRSQRPDFWVDFVIDVVSLFPDKWDYVIVPDTRFPNEINRLRECGYTAIHLHVERPNFDNGLSAEQKAHKSETALNETKPDYTVLNDGTLDDLAEKANRIGEFLTKKAEPVNINDGIVCEHCGDIFGIFDLGFDEDEREPVCPNCGASIDLPEGM